MSADYAPGYAGDALAMLGRRTATERAGFVLPLLRAGWRVLDLGCGPGTISAGLAEAIGPDGRLIGLDAEPSQLRLARTHGPPTAYFGHALADRLPLATHSVDLAFAHAVFEHLADPAAALAQLRRVLRPGGLLALSSSDWSRAEIEPRTDAVDTALAGHFALRRRAGGDPFAGGRLARLVTEAGFTQVRETVCARVDQSYRDIAEYVRVRLAAHPELAEHEEAARRWREDGEGTFTQCWVEVTAHTPR